jgi:hypothetical protein
MMSTDVETSHADHQRLWEALVATLADGEQSIFGAIQDMAPQFYKDGDHEGFVMMMRAMQMMMSEPRIASRYRGEIGNEVEKALGHKLDFHKITRVFNSKDGARRMRKLGEVQSELIRDGAPLVAGQTFDECLQQYRRLTQHVEHLWDDACRHYREGRFRYAPFSRS